MDYSSLSPSLVSLYLAALALGGVLSVWLVRLPALAIWFLALSLVSGQALRLPLPGQGGGLLLSDFAVVAVILSAVLFWLSGTPSNKTRLLSRSVTGSPVFFLLFIAWSLFTLALNYSALPNEHLLIAGSYWARLTSLLLLVPALFFLAGQTSFRRTLKVSFLFAIALIIILGFTQLFLIPHINAIGGGWDPHESRLVSTWLDPNFLGLFLVMATFFLIAQLLPFSWRLPNLLVLALLIPTVIALAATQSRSSLIALVATLVLLSPFVFLRLASRLTAQRVVQIVVLGSFVLVNIIFAATLLGPRLTGLVTSDPTVALRATSLVAVWNLAMQHPIVGVGYNTYQFAVQKAGLIDNFAIHSRAGADNSFLTLWVTTGLIGLILFSCAWLVTLTGTLRRWLTTQNANSLAASASLIALFVHSQFINSFLYAHLLITLAIIVAQSQAESTHPTKVTISN